MTYSPPDILLVHDKLHWLYCKFVSSHLQQLNYAYDILLYTLNFQYLNDSNYMNGSNYLNHWTNDHFVDMCDTIYDIPIVFYTHEATSRYFSTHTKLQLCDRLELLELQVKWHGPHSRCMWYHLWKTGGRFRFGNDEKSAARVSSCIFAYLFMCQCICRTGECVDVLLCINWFTLVYSQWVFWVQPVLEDDTRNAEFNGNRSPECWENCCQLQIRITQKSQFEFVPRNTSEFKSNQNLNSTLYREIPRYLVFSILSCWLKSPQHSGFRLPLNSAFRVSSSTERAVSIDLLWCIRSTDERWGAGVEYHFQEI